MRHIIGRPADSKKELDRASVERLMKAMAGFMAADSHAEAEAGERLAIIRAA